MINELSLFSGYGGLTLGLRLAQINVRTVAYVEWDKYPQEIIKARIRDGYLDDAPVFGNISSFRGEQFRGVVDIITAGFPCQPHSVAGLQRGATDDRNRWPDTLRVIREVEPRWVILENVPGLLSASADGGRPAYGGTVVGELASLGYSVHWRTIGADDVGAPHKRKRWWCIAELADSGGRRYWQSNKEICSGGDTPEHGIGVLADSRRKPTREPSARPDRGWENASPAARVRATEGHRPPDGNNPLADSDGQRGRCWDTTGQYAEDVGQPSTFEGDYPKWPPGPSDTDGWNRILGERPDLAPALTKDSLAAILRVDHGRSHRVDRLKALGNGVVPAVVAAFLRGLR